MRRSLMRNLLVILMLLAFAVAGTGCYGAGECPQGVCTEKHSKETGPPEEAAPSEETGSSEEQSGE